MRRNAITFGLIGLVLALLIGLNLLAVSKESKEENEEHGSRSSYKGTPYGTLAYFELLKASGYRVSRFEKPYTALSDSSVRTLLIVCPRQETFTDEDEFEALSDWVAGGGRVVIIDRIVNVTVAWVTLRTGSPIRGEPRPSSVSPITRGVRKLKATQYATAVEDVDGTSVVHVRASDGDLLIGRTVGSGTLTVLTEPYFIQNNGLREADNLSLALNLLGSAEDAGAIAFDEYHHGYGQGAPGDAGGGLRGYIAGTPVPWIGAQLGLLALVVAVTWGRRFARPVPLKRERRTSALEFVSSMANIQRLARASDLAIENIYGHFRRRLCRFAGLPSNTMTDQLATVAAERGQIDREELLSVMRRCDNALAIRPPDPRDLVDLIADLRRVESKLKL